VKALEKFELGMQVDGMGTRRADFERVSGHLFCAKNMFLTIMPSLLSCFATVQGIDRTVPDSYASRVSASGTLPWHRIFATLFEA
jgi:hypothetical protein